jgi:hypothetical protein
VIAGKKDDQHLGVIKIREPVGLSVGGRQFEIWSFASDLQCEFHKYRVLS